MLSPQVSPQHLFLFLLGRSVALTMKLYGVFFKYCIVIINPHGLTTWTVQYSCSNRCQEHLKTWPGFGFDFLQKKLVSFYSPGLNPPGDYRGFSPWSNLQVCRLDLLDIYTLGESTWKDAVGSQAPKTLGTAKFPPPHQATPTRKCFGKELYISHHFPFIREIVIYLL